MSITTKDLEPLIYDPNAVLKYMLEGTGDYIINDPTNPFVMLMEASATLASASAAESVTILRKLYPSLATSTSDLIHHVNDDELLNVFSYPATANLVLYVNVKELKTNGVYNDVYGYTETIVPAGTVITITNVIFTLLNNIKIKLYDTGVVFVEQMTSTDDVADNQLGVLSSGILSFQNGEPWVALETSVKQVRKSTITKPVTASEGFNLKVTNKDRYYYSNVYYKNSATNNVWVKLNKSHADEYINPSVPTVYITVIDGEIVYNIPDVYLLSGQVSGEIKIEIYETKGYINLPLYKYNMSEYSVDVDVPTSDPVIASVKNITVYSNSRDIVNGGKTGYNYTELKDSIINNTLGNITLPITDAQLKKTADYHNFKLYNALDIVTDRVYIASKNMDKLDTDLVYCKPDIYFNTVNIELGVINSSKVVVTDEYAMIPSGTVFKEINGIVTIVDDIELTNIRNFNNAMLVTYLQSNNMYYTPYYYVIDTVNTNVIESRVYDLDTPELRDIKILAKNINLIERVNVGKYGLYKTDDGYDLVITLLMNNEFGSLDLSLVKGQLSVEILNGDTLAHFVGDYDPTTEMMTFKIGSNFNIDNIDRLELTNGIADVSNVFTNLLSKAYIYLFTTESVVVDSTNFLVDEIMLNYTDVVVFDKEVLNIELGRRIDYIWNKLFVTYNDRMYLKHTVDKPLTYKSDVYEKDPETGSILQVVTDLDGNKSVVKNLLHSEGEQVIDQDGNLVYEYRTGDIVLDANNIPSIDVIGGVVRHVDILMLEYEFMVANTTIYKNYARSVQDVLRSWLFDNLYSLNKNTLENTKILYKSYKKSTPVKIKSSSVVSNVDYKLKPTITLYSTREDYSKEEFAVLRTNIGYIIHDAIDQQNVNLIELKNKILAMLGDVVVGVKIDGVETSNGSEVFSTVLETERLTIDKSLEVTNNNELIVIYNIDLKVHKV